MAIAKEDSIVGLSGKGEDIAVTTNRGLSSQDIVGLYKIRTVLIPGVPLKSRASTATDAYWYNISQAENKALRTHVAGLRSLRSMRFTAVVVMHSEHKKRQK